MVASSVAAAPAAPGTANNDLLVVLLLGKRRQLVLRVHWCGLVLLGGGGRGCRVHVLLLDWAALLVDGDWCSRGRVHVDGGNGLRGLAARRCC